LAPPRLNRSLWLENAAVNFPHLTDDLEVEVAVIGGGSPA